MIDILIYTTIGFALIMLCKMVDEIMKTLDEPKTRGMSEMKYAADDQEML